MARNVLTQEKTIALIDFLRSHKEEIEKSPFKKTLFSVNEELFFEVSRNNLKNMLRTLCISLRGRAQIVSYSNGLANDLMLITDCILEIYQRAGTTESTSRQNLLTLRDTLRRKNAA